MAKNKNYFESLESIIKVEPEEFQTNFLKPNDRQSADNILRSKANIFSDLVVILERHTFESPSLTFHSDDRHSEKVETLARRGNEGLGCLDPHTCCLCTKVSTNRNNLKLHLERVHLKTKKMSCDLCPKFYFHKYAISQHMKQIHCKKKFACNVCDYKTANSWSFERHKLTHAAKIECPECKKEVTSLKGHMRTHKPKVSCTICKKMVNKFRMKSHMKTHTGKKCKNCDEAFGNREDLRRHILWQHYDGKLYECHCGSVYKSKRNLKYHQQSHKDKKPTCAVCQEQFSSINSLKCHWRRTQHDPSEDKMRVLNRNDPFICDECGSRSTSRQSFINHIQRHKSAAKFDCDLCPRSYNRKQHLVTHMERDHLKVRSFKCEICNYSSFSRWDLKKHMLRHGSKTECKICHKLVSNMYTHLKNHVKGKCPICGKIYSKKNIHRHIRTHDNKKTSSIRRY